MKRRTLIKQLVFASGAILLIPGCISDKSKVSILLKKISIDGEQEKLMAELAETIIPKTDTPGAKDIAAHLFALMMVDDCYTAKAQQQFLTGLRSFEIKTKKQFGKSFIECSVAEKDTLLDELESKKTGNSDLDHFYSTTKRLTIQAYTSSKFYLTKVQVYKLVPGRYHGCAPLTNAS